MARFYDRILTDGVYTGRAIKSPLRVNTHPVVLSIQNVFDYYREQIAPQHTETPFDTVRDFPNLAPPFPHFWMEFDMKRPWDALPGITAAGVDFVGTDCQAILPDMQERYPEYYAGIRRMYDTLRSGKQLDRHDKYALDIPENTLFMLPQADEDIPGAIWRYLSGFESKGEIENLEQHINRGGFITAALQDYLDIRWILTLDLFVETGRGKAQGVILKAVEFIDSHGLIAKQQSGGGTVVYYPDLDFYHGDIATADQYLPQWTTGIIFPCLLAISFMHCKNVVRTPIEPPAKLSKAHQKRHGKPLVKYYTLEIEPMKEVLKREGQSEKAGLKRALHICRGHFATYTPEKPLFGHFVGTVWKAAHVRGSLKEGLIVKDYAVKEPHNASH